VALLTMQKLLGLEDETEERTKELVTKIESLEAITRMLELKSKNSSDHGESHPLQLSNC